MDWVKDFYSKQYQLLNSPYWWQRLSMSDPPDYAKKNAADIERLARPGHKRVLELGCGGGVTAGAIALLGHSVVAVDLVEAATENAERIAAELPHGSLSVLTADFYELEFTELFDVVCYFDGFGVGSDADQQRLLKRIASWLRPDACAIIDIYSPWLIAARATGAPYQEGDLMLRSEFDAEHSRHLESYWHADIDESRAVTQRLRCYSPADLRLLLTGTGLALETFEPYGEEGPCPLIESWYYRAKLVHL